MGMGMRKSIVIIMSTALPYTAHLPLQAGSPSEFVHLAAGAWRCHFHWGGECGPTALYGWAMAALHVMFLGLLGKVMAATQSMVFALATTALALPIQAIWWSLFTMGGPLGMVWQPQVSSCGWQ